MTLPKPDGRLVEALQIAALASLGVARPLYDFLERNSEFLIARQANASDIVLLALVISVGLPALLVALIELAGRAGDAIRQRVRVATVFCLVLALSLLALKNVGDLEGAGFATVALAAVMAGLVTAGVLRFAVVRAWLTWLGPAVLVVPLMFLCLSPASKLVLTRESGMRFPHVDSQTPVVMVVFDELPVTALMDGNHAIDAGRFPAFGALARESIWFRNATTVADHTHNALPALLTGTWPDTFKEPTFADYPRNLFTLLGGSHEIRAVEAVTRLCPPLLNADEALHGSTGTLLSTMLGDLSVIYVHLLLPKDLRSRLRPLQHNPMWEALGRRAEPQSTPPAPEGRRRDFPFQSIVEAVTRDTGAHPPLYFVHLVLPHVPYTYLPSGQEYAILETPMLYGQPRSDLWVDDPRSVTPFWRRFLLQTAFVDRLLGQLVAKLKAVGLYDRALLVVVTDHGVSFAVPDQRRVITRGNKGGIMPVPLFVKLPRQHAGRVDDRNAMAVDVLPTVADALGIRIPDWKLDGRSLLGAPDSARTTKTIFDNHNRRLDFSCAEVARARDAVLEEQLRLFSSGSLDGVYRGGPDPGLAGRSVDALPCRGLWSGTVQVWKPERFRAVDPARHLVPTHVSGTCRLPSGDAGGVSLAIALNGVIVAVTETVRPTGDHGGFEALLPVDRLRAGENRLEVYVVRGRGDTACLEATRPEGAGTASR